MESRDTRCIASALRHTRATSRYQRVQHSRDSAGGASETCWRRVLQHEKPIEANALLQPARKKGKKGASPQTGSALAISRRGMPAHGASAYGWCLAATAPNHATSPATGACSQAGGRGSVGGGAGGGSLGDGREGQ